MVYIEDEFRKVMESVVVKKLNEIFDYVYATKHKRFQSLK